MSSSLLWLRSKMFCQKDTRVCAVWTEFRLRFSDVPTRVHDNHRIFQGIQKICRCTVNLFVTFLFSTKTGNLWEISFCHAGLWIFVVPRRNYRFVQNLLLFPEILAAPNSWKIPNHTWGVKKATRIRKTPNHKRKRWTLKGCEARKLVAVMWRTRIIDLRCWWKYGCTRV